MRILVVDDVRAPRRVLKQILTQLGYKSVQEADCAQKAVMELETGEIDLVLCDYHLPDGNAAEILKQVREKDSTRSMPFIVMTSDLVRENFMEVKELGVSGYLLKPFSLENVEEQLKAAFSYHGIKR